MRRSFLFCVVTLIASAAAAQTQQSDLAVRDVAFSPDGRYLAVSRGGFDDQKGDVTVWDMSTRTAAFTHSAKRGLPSVAFAAKGDLLAVASYENAAKLLEVPSGKVRREFVHADGVRAVALAADATTLITCCRDHKIHVWDVATGKERYALPAKEIPRIVSIHPDGQTFLAIQEGKIAVMDVATGKPRFQLDQGGDAHVYFALYSADGRWIMTSDNHARVVVWRAGDGSRRVTVGRAFAYNALAFEPRSGWMATATGWSRRLNLLRVRLDEPTGQEKDRLQALLAELDDDALPVREKASAELLAMGFLAERELGRVKENSPSAEVRMRARWLHDKIIDARFEEFPPLPSRPEGVAFSPDGKLIASGTAHGSTYVWDLASRSVIAQLQPR
jgi:WD40 repeat protein